MRRGLLTCCIVLGLMTAPLPAGAASKPPAKRTPSPVAEAPPQAAAALAGEMDATQLRLETLNGAIQDLDSQVAFAKSKIKVTEDYLRQWQVYEAEWSRYLSALQARIDSVQRDLRFAATVLYQRGRDEGSAVYAALMASENPRDSLTAARYVSGSLAGQRVHLEELARLRQQAEVVTREAAAKSAEVRDTQIRLITDRKTLEKLRGQVASVRTKAKVEQKKEQVLLAKVQAKKEQYLREIALLEAESSAIAKWLRGLQLKQRAALRRRGTFALPLTGRMSSGFGPRTHPIYGDTRVHTGVDFSIGPGTPIRAAGPGKVVWVGGRGGYGNLVVIDHGNGLATLYAHQSRLVVSLNQEVKTGEVVGEVGSTGLSTGPHLHFEVREKGSPVDPYFYL